MKLLVAHDHDIINALAYDIEDIEDPDTHEHMWQLIDEQGIPYGDPYDYDNYYVYVVDDPYIIDELKNVPEITKYCIQGGRIVYLEDYSLDEIKRLKREVEKMRDNLEVTQVEMLYDISLLILGLEGGLK